MPSWGEIGREIILFDPATLSPGSSQFDLIRRKYMAQMHGLTGRAIIVYATKWTMPNVGASVPPDMLSITANDIHGFMETVDGLTDRGLDLIIHGPRKLLKQSLYICVRNLIIFVFSFHIWLCRPPHAGVRF
jgi:hypothetical protein